MEVIAISRSIKVSPRKIRLVADEIRNTEALKALDILSLIKKRGSVSLKKTLESAIANAVNNKKLAKENLTIKLIDISEGSAFKRFHPSTRGRVHPYKKRTSNIRIVLEDKSAKEEPVKVEESIKVNKKEEKPKKEAK